MTYTLRMLVFGPGFASLTIVQMASRARYFIAAFAAAWFVYRDFFIAPVQILKHEIETPVVRVGDMVERRICVIRRRSCETDPDVMIIAANGDRLHFHSPPITAPGPLHVEDCYRSSTELPDRGGDGRRKMTPGIAELRVTVTYSCSPIHRIFGPYRLTMPPLKFTVPP